MNEIKQLGVIITLKGDSFNVSYPTVIHSVEGDMVNLGDPNKPASWLFRATKQELTDGENEHAKFELVGSINFKDSK